MLLEYTSCYNSSRPHQGLDQRITVTQREPVVDTEPVICHEVLSHAYQRAIWLVTEQTLHKKKGQPRGVDPEDFQCRMD